MLRSQNGVEDVEDPYNNLRQGLLKIKARKDIPIDLAKLTQLLEEEVGFRPITEVRLELRGRLKRVNDNLLFQTTSTDQTFTVDRVEGEATAPPENQLLSVVAPLVNPRSADRIVVQEWKVAEGEAGSASPKSARATPVATAELVISGMT